MDSPTEVSDVFSLSDHLLAERLQFVKEIGFGNWGSVWLCRPKSSSGKVRDIEVAVKLVHRSKTSTTAARVRSLWNEMKIVRSFKNDPHPSVVPFHSFIITPSYALITMAYLPTLVPVEVSEPRAKEWFKSLLSGVHFLHSRGVVHNDIKPANILLSRTNKPVLVDFGFAEKYDLASPKAFHSNLTYGTPEYLSPERARGIPHDTRKSDVWSLGVTFFEILVGRTPFEYEEGEVFEKKEDLEKYWHRTMRGKWVGKYSVSHPIERLLKRMIVPNADLRCTAAELIGDPYWDVNLAHGHRKSASAAVPSSAHTRTSSLFNSFRESFKDKEKEKEPSLSRLLDISLPWSASKSGSRPSVSRTTSGTESTSRPASRTGVNSRPASRTESTPRAASAIPSQSRTPERPSAASTPSNRHAIVEQTSSTSMSPGVRTRTHSRSRSQSKLRSPPGISTAVRTRKLSTVQASPVVKPQRQIVAATESDQEKDAGVCKAQDIATTLRPQTLVSLNSNSSMRRPAEPRQPSRIPLVSSATKKSSVGQVGTTEKKHALAHLTHLQTSEAKRTDTPAPTRPPTPRSVTQTSARAVSCQTPIHSMQTSRQTSASKQLSGKPSRTRGRAGVLVDLTGFARNVDLSAHGVGRPVKRGGEKKDRGKERSRTTAQKENKENEGLPPAHAPRRDAHRVSGCAPLSPKTPVKAQDSTTTMSISLAANLSNSTTVTKGSVRDRMMDWERERERLREMNKFTDTSADERSNTDADSSDDDSSVEAEVVAEAAAAQAKSKLPAEIELPKVAAASTQTNSKPLADTEAPKVTETVPVRAKSKPSAKIGELKEVLAHVEAARLSTTQSQTTISSSSSNLERSRIEVAKIGFRASAQILSSRNGSVVALGRGQSTEKQPLQESQAKNDTMTNNGLPVEVPRNSESGFSSLKHSVKVSIDKGMRFCKSSTLGQLTGRSTPVWCASPEPIDFEQRRSDEEGRFSWENIRPEHEVAVDRMNLWIQSVEKVVEETRQNFASTSVTPPAPLPLAPISRSSSQYPGTLNTPTSTTLNNNTLSASCSSRVPRRLLAANEIFADSTDPNAPLSTAPTSGEDPSTSFSYVHAPGLSVPVLPPTSLLVQTPRRRRATISTNSPQTKNGSGASGIFDGTPSKRREKSKSQSNLDRHIQDVAKLELELNRAPVSSPPPRLSTVLDRSLFVKPPLSPRATEDPVATSEATRGRSIQFNDLDSSPYHVQPYPPRKSGEQVILESPNKQHLEGVYDRFLMATSGVRRVGKGYQSENLKPVHNTMNTAEHAKASHARGLGVFGAGRRPMPPPVSSEDAWGRTTTVDELGFATATRRVNTSSSHACKDENKPTSTFVRRAIKAMVPGKTVSRRIPHTIVV